jgi:hypothetical protein
MWTMGAAGAMGGAANQTLWQLNVPFELQGRVMSARMMVALSTPLLALLLAIPLQEEIFVPLVRRGAADAHSWLGAIWGNHPGSAIGMMISSLAATMLIVTVAVLLRGGFGLKPDGRITAAEVGAEV